MAKGQGVVTGRDGQGQQGWVVVQRRRTWWPPRCLRRRLAPRQGGEPTAWVQGCRRGSTWLVPAAGRGQERARTSGGRWGAGAQRARGVRRQRSMRAAQERSAREASGGCPSPRRLRSGRWRATLRSRGRRPGRRASLLRRRRATRWRRRPAQARRIGPMRPREGRRQRAPRTAGATGPQRNAACWTRWRTRAVRHRPSRRSVRRTARGTRGGRPLARRSETGGRPGETERRAHRGTPHAARRGPRCSLCSRAKAAFVTSPRAFGREG